MVSAFTVILIVALLADIIAGDVSGKDKAKKQFLELIG